MDYEFTLRGTTPLLMHADDVMASDELMAWRKDPKNKPLFVPGDDRTPPWAWQTYLYHDGKHLSMPQENILAAIRYAGARIPLKGTTTFKSLTQSGLLIDADHCVLLVNGSQIERRDIVAFRDDPFSAHVSQCRELGFDLLVKRANVEKKKHVRVRAKLEHWSVEGSIMVTEPAITPNILEQMFEIAGRLGGLGDWRPSAPKSPGPHGMFKAELRPLKSAKRAG